MSEFVAITFDGPRDADSALGSIRALEKDGRVQLEDTAVVRKDAEGKVTIHKEMASGTETGAVIGAVLGGLLLAVFPPAAVVGGAIAGGLVGRAAAPGIDGAFVKEVGEDLPPGGSALFLQIKSGQAELLIGALGRYHGRVRQTSLPDELEHALDESLR